MLTYWGKKTHQGASQSVVTTNWTPGTVAKTVSRSLEMQQMLQVDLLLRAANLTTLVTTRHGTHSQMDHSNKRIHLINPHKNLQDSSKRNIIDQVPRTAHLAGNLSHKLNKVLKIHISHCQLPFWWWPITGYGTHRPPSNDILAVVWSHGQNGNWWWPVFTVAYGPSPINIPVVAVSNVTPLKHFLPYLEVFTNNICIPKWFVHILL